MRRKDAYDRDALHFAPFVLFPSPFPRSISTPNARATLKSSKAVNQPTHPPLCILAWHPLLFHFRTSFILPLISIALHHPSIEPLQSTTYNNLFLHSLSSFHLTSKSHTALPVNQSKSRRGTKGGGLWNFFPPREEFHKAVALQTTLNELMHHVSRPFEWADAMQRMGLHNERIEKKRFDSFQLNYHT